MQSTSHQFTFDTSGAVRETQDNPPRFYPNPCMWSDLSPFEQGYVAAMLGDLRLKLASWVADELNGEAPWPNYANPRFSDLAPETLALIRRDCAARLAQNEELPDWPDDDMREAGSGFWECRSEGDRVDDGFSPLTPYLGDDGKVYLREGA
jgi:hypothetical protein